MNTTKSPENYIDAHPQWRQVLEELRLLLLATELDECIKWGVPTYCLKGKNVVALAAFNSYVGLWFFNGAMLKDNDKVLVNAQQGKTQAMRHLRFSHEQDFKQQLAADFIQAAINNQKAGLVFKANLKRPLEIPPELQQQLLHNKKLNTEFVQLGLSKQREYTEFISTAKRDATKLARLEKITPMILQGKGLNDKYR